MNCNRNEKCGFSSCSCLSIVISIVFGAIVGIAYAYRIIPCILVSVWIAFILGILALILLAVSVFIAAVTAPNALSKCLCGNAACLLAGIFGTIISALIVLSIVLNHTCILAVTLVAIGAFFFSLLVIGLIAYIYCIVCRMCYPKE